MASMEVSMMKGVAYDLTFTGDGESYALVIDSRFTQPPHDFQVRVGLDQLTLDVTGTFNTFADILNIFGGGDDSGLEITFSFSTICDSCFKPKPKFSQRTNRL